MKFDWRTYKDQGVEKLKSYLIQKREDVRYSFTRVLGLRVHETTDPDVATKIFTDARLKIFKDPGFVVSTFKKLVGNALALNSGKSWEHMRKAYAPYFSKQAVLDRAAPIMIEECKTMLFEWQKATNNINVVDDMQASTGRTIMRYLIGDNHKEASAQIVQLAGSALHQLHDPDHEKTKKASVAPYDLGIFIRSILMKALGITGRCPGKVPTRLLQSNKEASKIVIDVIRDRRKLAEQPDDVLGMLINLKKLNGKPLSDKEIKNEIIALIMAGHESTANTVAFGVDEASRNPSIQIKLAKEFQEVTNGTPLTSAHIPKLEFAANTFQEAMRQYPAIATTTREARARHDFMGIALKKGDLIRLNIYDIQNDPVIWGNPETFEPERYDRPKCPMHAFLALGRGKRSCLGDFFARTQGTINLSMSHGVFNIVATQNLEGAEQYYVTQPKGELIVSVEPTEYFYEQFGLNGIS